MTSTPDNKFALVTGGTRGIGAAIVNMLLAEGYDVLATFSSDFETANEFMAQCHRQHPNQIFEIFKANQSCGDEMSRLVDRLSGIKIDCIVFNAGVTLRKSIHNISNEDWLWAMDANVNSNVFLLRDLLPQIVDGARLIFIGSMMAVKPHATSLAYGVTKAAVHALALNLVKVFEGTGTTVNAIAPGFVDTDWQKNKPNEIRESICSKTAVKRFASPEEIADVARFCINNPFVNGAVIEISGGYDFK